MLSTVEARVVALCNLVYMPIIYIFIWWNPHWPPKQPQSETGTSCRWGWWLPCQWKPLYLRSWHGGRSGCFEGVYLPLSQLHTTWNNLKGCNLVSWEANIPCDLWSIRFGLQPEWVVITMEAFLGSKHSYLTYWLFVFWSWLKIFSSKKKMMWFVLAGFLLVRKAFSTVAQVAYSTCFWKWRQFVYIILY